MSEPLTPATADLQDFPFMPLHVARLRDSDLASEVAPEACWYAVLLWAAAWHQLPAGSLPDNEVVLTKLCGLGRDLRTFRKHRAGALRGFVLCTDGRLYHPVIAEQVRSAWTGKLQQRWRSELARIKKANQRNGTNIEGPTYDDFLVSIGEAVSHECPPSVPGDSDICPPGQAVQEKGTGTGTPNKEAIASSVGSEIATVGLFGEEPVSEPAPKPKPWASNAAFAAFWSVAGAAMKTRSSQAKVWPEWKRVSAQIGAEQLLAALKRYTAEDGDFQRTGGPGLHSWLKDGRWEHWLSDAGITGLPPTRRFADAAIRSAVMDHDPDTCLKWLDKCDWIAADRVIVPPNSFVGEQLAKGAGSVLRAHDITAIRPAAKEAA